MEDLMKVVLLKRTNCNKKVKLLNAKVDGSIHLLNKYRRARKQCVQKIVHLQNITKLLTHSVVSWRVPKAMWTLTRTSKFWEYDVPNNADQFFENNFRMKRSSFEKLCGKLSSLERTNTPYRNCIPLSKRIAIGLYALGSPVEYRTVANLFGVGIATVCCIVKEVCQEIWRVMKCEYLNAYPLTETKIKECIEGFQKLGFPQCFGAIDGCHIEIKPHATDAVDYHNYEGWCSTVLLALVDYRYRFLYINVGSPGRCNDSSIYENSSLKMEHCKPILTEMSRIISGVAVPALIIGDSAFRFSPMLMKPYPYTSIWTQKEKDFNYSLSKCRRVVENAFGHLKARFRRVGKGIDNNIKNVPLIIKACCVLHNFLNEENDEINAKWLEDLRRYVAESAHEQPVSEDILDDNNSQAELIRNAIASSLDFGVEADDRGGVEMLTIPQAIT